MGLLRLDDGVTFGLEDFRVLGEVVVAKDVLLGGGTLVGRLLQNGCGLDGELGINVFALGFRLSLLGGRCGLAFFGELLFPGGDGCGQRR